MEKACLVCKKTDNEMPLLKFEFKGQDAYICSQHMPVLIHNAHQLKEMLPGLEVEESDD